MADNITVKVLDTITGNIAVSSEHSFLWWSEGNGSCDCNRELLFDSDLNWDKPCVSVRYVIIETSYGDLSELNAGYSAYA